MDSAAIAGLKENEALWFCGCFFLKDKDHIKRKRGLIVFNAFNKRFANLKFWWTVAVEIKTLAREKSRVEAPLNISKFVVFFFSFSAMNKWNATDAVAHNNVKNGKKR